jgi:hypothetical protein
MQMLSQAARASRSDAVDVTTTATNDSELRLGESVTTPLWQHLACRTRRTQAGQHHQTAETAPESALLQKRPRLHPRQARECDDDTRFQTASERPRAQCYSSTTRAHTEAHRAQPHPSTHGLDRVKESRLSTLDSRWGVVWRTALTQSVKPACLRACSVMWQNGQQQRDSTADAADCGLTHMSVTHLPQIWNRIQSWLRYPF